MPSLLSSAAFLLLLEGRGASEDIAVIVRGISTFHPLLTSPAACTGRLWDRPSRTRTASDTGWDRGPAPSILLGYPASATGKKSRYRGT